MSNERKEINDGHAVRRSRQGSEFKELLGWALGGAAIALLIRKLLDIIIKTRNPPITIKSGSFLIGVHRTIGDLEEDHSPPTEDDDLLDSRIRYHAYKQEKREIKYVVVYDGKKPVNCYKFNTDASNRGRCIIQFFFGVPSGSAHPDIIVKGKNLRVMSKGRLNRVTDIPDLRYHFRRADGNNLCAVIFRRNGSKLEKLSDLIHFDDAGNTCLEIDSDSSGYDLCRRNI